MDWDCPKHKNFIKAHQSCMALRKGTSFWEGMCLRNKSKQPDVLDQITCELKTQQSAVDAHLCSEIADWIAAWFFSKLYLLKRKLWEDYSNVGSCRERWVVIGRVVAMQFTMQLVLYAQNIYSMTSITCTRRCAPKGMCSQVFKCIHYQFCTLSMPGVVVKALQLLSGFFPSFISF